MLVIVNVTDPVGSSIVTALPMAAVAVNVADHPGEGQTITNNAAARTTPRPARRDLPRPPLRTLGPPYYIVG